MWVLWLPTDISTCLSLSFFSSKTEIQDLHSRVIMKTIWANSIKCVLSECESFFFSSALLREQPRSLSHPTITFLGVFAGGQLKLHLGKLLISLEFFLLESQATDSHLSFLWTSMKSTFQKVFGTLLPKSCFSLPKISEMWIYCI